MTEQKKAPMVKVVLERHIPTLGIPGMTVEVPEAVAQQLTTPRMVHNGTTLVKVRSARPFDEKLDSPTVGDMSVSEMRQAGLKNVIETPEQYKGASAAAKNFQAAEAGKAGSDAAANGEGGKPSKATKKAPKAEKAKAPKKPKANAKQDADAVATIGEGGEQSAS